MSAAQKDAIANFLARFLPPLIAAAIPVATGTLWLHSRLSELTSVTAQHTEEIATLRVIDREQDARIATIDRDTSATRAETLARLNSIDIRLAEIANQLRSKP